MKTINVNNTIENYLSGNAGKAEKAWLLDEMQKDPNLAREVSLRRKTNEILARKDIIDLRTKLAAIEMKKRSGMSLRKTAVRTARYAAAVALVALISTVIYFSVRQTSSKDLYQKYYSRYELPGAVRSVAGTGNSLMDKAIASYTMKDYEEAIGYLEQLISSGQNNMESVFMHGMANMEVSNYPMASRSFNKVLENNNNLYLEDAAWYLGLCYMMNGEKEKAVSQFNTIAESKSRYSRQAARLARRLR
jgi:tetratricopeptide (TPR) repeat protein